MQLPDFKYLIIFCLTSIVGGVGLHSIHKTVEAQVPEFAIATTYNLGEEHEDGDIVSFSDDPGTLRLSNTDNDERMFGVYVENPKAVYRTATASSPIVRKGEVQVNVSSLGGPIAVGDYVTSSTIPGKGKKAEEYTGYMLGVALTPFGENEGTERTVDGKTVRVGKIFVAVGIGPASPVMIRASGGLFGTLRFLATSLAINLQNNRFLDKWIRYIIAAIVALTTMYINYRTFGKNITKGIESIGRNPLAKAAIQSMIVMNIVLIAVVSIAGIILALAILSL